MNDNNSAVAVIARTEGEKKRDLWRMVSITKFSLTKAVKLCPKDCTFKFWFSEWLDQKLDEDIKEKNARAAKGVVQLDECNTAWVKDHCPEDRKGDAEAWFNEIFYELLEAVERMQGLVEDFSAGTKTESA